MYVSARVDICYELLSNIFEVCKTALWADLQAAEEKEHD